MSERPSSSVVVASFRNLQCLSRCLESLRPQCAKHGAELVVCRASREPATILAPIVAGCRLVAAPPDATVPMLRGLGLSEARGRWVALTEDHCVADPDWLKSLLTAASADVDVLGGRMGNAQRERGIDCGAFFAEYGYFSADPARQPAQGPPLITEANAAYRENVVAEVATWARAGAWENVIHDRLFRAGSKFRLVPQAAIRQNLNYDFKAFCQDRIAHGRDYAATRAADRSRWKRLLFLAGSPALPPLLTLRIVRALSLDERRFLGRGLPYMFAFLSAWAVGEALGYGRSLMTARRWHAF